MQEQVSYRTSKQGFGVELIDAHCHLELFSNVKIAISDAKMAGVREMITAGGTKESSLAAVGIANGMDVFAVIGIDPSAKKEDASFVDEIEGIIKSHRSVVGIGEIGLDYKLPNHDKEYQIELFTRQISIAKKLDVPIVVHSRGAIEDAMKIVQEQKVRKVMFHFFEGDEHQAKTLSEQGYLLSIPPIESSRRKRVINSVALSSIAVETDSPVVGKSPIDVIKTVGWIAQIKGVSFEDAAFDITKNVKKLFNI